MLNGQIKSGIVGKDTAASEAKSGIVIHKPISPARITEVYDSYWLFAAKRQELFFNRLKGGESPWSDDPIICKHRFTNVYRATDRVSQYLISQVIYDENLPNTPQEILFRILLFKLFNKIETWELLKTKIGEITYKSYDFNVYDKILNDAFTRGITIYSAAYIIPSVEATFGYKRKHSNHLKLIEVFIESKAHVYLMKAKTMQQAFELIKKFPGLGDFLAYQLLIDINYSPILNFSESEFVVAGPGAKGGISKCFSDTAGLSNVEIIKLMADRQEYEFERLGLNFNTLWGRRLQLIDCQNIFCEVDKYARVKHPDIKGGSDRIRIKQVFKCNPKPLSLWFPPKWGLNEFIPNVLITEKSQ